MSVVDWNESLFPPPPQVKEDIFKFIDSDRLENYPDISNKILLQSLSDYTKLPIECIEAYNGSDDALRDIFTAFVDESKSVLSYQPTYSQVDTFIETNTNLYNKKEIIDPLGEHLYDFSLCGSYDVVYLVNPNNPTGKLIQVKQIEKLASSSPNTLFVIDEAYYEYSNVTCSELILKYKNILVTRTFSKAFGIASLRLGYVLGFPSTLDELKKIKNGKCVNAMALVAGTACLKDLEYLHSCVKHTKRSTAMFMQEISKLKDHFVVESVSNYVLFQVPNVEDFKKKMESNKILIRDRSYLTNLERCVRINLGPMKHTKKIIKIMKEKL